MAPLSTYKVSSFEHASLINSTCYILLGVDLRAILLCIDMEGLQNLFRVGKALVCAWLGLFDLYLFAVYEKLASANST